MRMGAAQRWKLLPFRSKPKLRVQDVLAAPSTPPSNEEEAEEEAPGEFLCPILRAPMADPVILTSGTTFERACVRACADLGLALGPDGAVVAGDATEAAPVGIPNDALRAAIRKWCARSGRAPPVPPSVNEAMDAVLRVAPVRSVSNLSCSTSRPSAASTSSSSSSSSAGSSSSAEMSAAAAEVEVDVVRVKEVAAEKEIEEAEPPVVSLPDSPAAEPEAEEDAWARAVENGTATEAAAAVSSLRRATRESAARRRALCTPRLLAALLSPRLHHHRSATLAARADAAAALANLATEPDNRVAIVRAGAVPALIDALASPSSPPEAREHAAGALFGLALREGNRAAVGVLGAVPPLLAVFSDRDLPPRARRDAGMALYHLSIAAVNQSKLARGGGGVRTLVAVASDGDEPALIRRLALMVACNVAACAEGREALMNAGAVAAATAILLSDGTPDLQHWCVAVLYGVSRDNARRFRGLARAAGSDCPLTLLAERPGGVSKEMAQTVLHVISGDGDVSDGEGGNGGRPHGRRAASWAAAPPAAAATPPWRSVCID